MATRENAHRSLSYKEKLGRNLKDLGEEHDELVADDDDEEDSEEETETDCPTIRLSKEEKIRIRRPWKKKFIIKLLGRSIGVSVMVF